MKVAVMHKGEVRNIAEVKSVSSQEEKKCLSRILDICSKHKQREELTMYSLLGKKN